MRKIKTLKDVERVLETGTAKEQVEAIEAYISSWVNSKGFSAASVVVFSKEDDKD